MFRPSDLPDQEVGVTAVISAFNPDQHLVRVCSSVIDQVDALVVVDDGSPDPDASILAQCAALGAIVVRQPNNSGIASALNRAIAIARDVETGRRQTSILTLDQDSVVPGGYVAALLAALREAESVGVRVAMVGPGHADGIRSAAGRSTGEIVFSREPIQSGLLITGSTIDAIGVFDDSLFIDGVDSEYFLRAERAKLRAIIAPGARLTHRLGQRYTVRIAQRRFEVVHAATFRYYYIARNRIALIRRYGRGAPGWAVGAWLRDMRHLMIVTAFVPGRWGRLRATAAGIKDGLRKVSGPRG